VFQQIGCRPGLRKEWKVRRVAGITLQTSIDRDPATQDTQRIRLTFCLLAAAGFAATLLVVPSAVLTDPDSWWHVRVGLDLLASRTFPTTDTYSHTFAGQPWIAKEWLGQVLLALAYSAAGWNGVVLLTIGTIALTVFLLASYLGRDLRPSVAFGFAFILAILLNPLYSARPYIFTFPIFVVWTAHLYEASRREETPPLWLLLLLVLWANLHATYFLGFAVAAFAFLDLFARVRFSRPGLLIRWVAFGAACPIAILINPYGAQVIPLIFGVMSGHEGIPLIGEWRPFNARELHLHEAALMTMFFGLLASGFRLSWPKALFTVFALHLFLSHIRFVYLFLLLVPIVISADLARQYPALSAGVWAKAQRDLLERFLATRTAWLAGAVAFFLACVHILGLHIEPKADISVADALGFAKERGLSGNVLNSYDLGGTLVFHGVKTFIDGRTDQLFLGGFMRNHAESGAASGKAKLQKQLDDYAISWALLTTKDSRTAFFDELPDWRRAYSDKYAVIYVRKEPTQ
jgi:hypothetical protein